MKKEKKNIFISYSHHDQNFVRKLKEALSNTDFSPWVAEFEINIGDNLLNKISEVLKSCEYIIPVISKNYQRSQWTLYEFNIFAIQQISKDGNKIFPVLIEDCEIPIFLRDKVYADFRSSFDEPFEKLLKGLKKQKEHSIESENLLKVSQKNKAEQINFQIENLRNFFHAGELVLVCGAGISVDAGIPPWQNLLNKLFADLFGSYTESFDFPIQSCHELAALYQKEYWASSLVMAQYLKNNLGKDFLFELRKILYGNSPENSDLIDAIVELCRPQRFVKSLHSIITFNFDDLIEYNLRKHHVQYKAIFSEGQKSELNKLPIYHVHGYLPREEDITSDHEIVFSEDTYHSQFIDPFSWSNLLQLNHFSQRTCLFLGLSMTDPNLRRLLDVSMRKNPEKLLNHYIFKKRYDLEKINSHIATLDVEGDKFRHAEAFKKIAEILEETDANKLGMNVIWIDSYDEIGKILRKIACNES